MSRATVLLFISSGVAALAAGVVIIGDIGPARTLPEPARADARLAQGGAATGTGSAAQEPCQVRFSARPLPTDIAESSGLARGIDRTDVFWTHNDAGGRPELFGVDENGTLRQRVQVRGARLVDWEDIASAPCDGESCLYIADTGNNDGERSTVTVYRIVEPGPGATTAPATPITARYPQGSPDAEALFAHDGRLYLVTKGRRAPVRLYRFPASSQASGAPGVLELVSELAPEPGSERNMVTGASASPDGQWVAIRTYRVLLVYPAAGLLSGGAPQPVRYDLARLREAQGEGVALGSEGEVWLTTEAGGGAGPSLSGLSCTLTGTG